jgi:hypothetical protein
MTLVACSECKKDISRNVKACPFCGDKKSSGVLKKVIVLMIVIFVIGKCSSYSQQSSSRKQAERTPEQIESDAKFSRDVGMLKAFSRTLHNPDSLKIESVIRLPDDSLCVEYRATNKFNALILSQLVILKDGKIGVWNTHCAGKSGVNITYIRTAL